jgi:hypothetical protein
MACCNGAKWNHSECGQLVQAKNRLEAYSKLPFEQSSDLPKLSWHIQHGDATTQSSIGFQPVSAVQDGWHVAAARNGTTPNAGNWCKQKTGWKQLEAYSKLPFEQSSDVPKLSWHIQHGDAMAQSRIDAPLRPTTEN